MVKVRGVRVMWCYSITLGRAGGPLAATSIGRGRKYKSAAICRLLHDTDFTARDIGYLEYRSIICGRGSGQHIDHRPYRNDGALEVWVSDHSSLTYLSPC